MRRVEVIGHRGAPLVHRENTLPSFARALDDGVDGLELDVHATRDGVVVVHHDPVVRTPGGGPGHGLSIAASSLEELRAATGEPTIPTLVEVLDLAGDRATVYVEIKARGIEKQVAEVLRACSTRCAVHSFDHRIVRAMRDHLPALRTGILLASYLIDPVAALHDARALDLWERWEYIDADLVDTIHTVGGRVIAWTVNEAPDAAALVELRVDAICTDASRAMVAAFGGAGA